MSVSEERAEQAIRYLAETDKEFARRETYFNGLDRLRHSVKGEAFALEDGNNAEREAAAYRSDSYKNHLSQMQIAEGEYLEMRYKRETERLVFDFWRSLNANRRQGG